jgi:hypothetical protein
LNYSDGKAWFAATLRENFLCTLEATATPTVNRNFWPKLMDLNNLIEALGEKTSITLAGLTIGIFSGFLPSVQDSASAPPSLNSGIGAAATN